MRSAIHALPFVKVSSSSRHVALMIERAHHDSTGGAAAEGAEKIVEAP